MYKVIVFGTGNLSKLLIQFLDYHNVEIITYLDNDESKWETYINNISVKNPDDLVKINYDFILIASQYNNEIYEQLVKLKVGKDRIFQYSIFVNNSPNYLKLKIDKFVNSDKYYKVISTGISYSMVGINGDILNYKIYSFANGSQDLYYDYKIVELISKKYNEVFKSIKYCLIGLSYYSFQYDLSLSSMKSKIIQYYDILKDYHNCKCYIDDEETTIINQKIAEKIIRKKLTRLKSEIFKEVSYKDKLDIGKKISEKDCNKNYPETVKENKQILKDYLKLLKDNNIKPIVVVFPASKYYTNYFSKRIEDEFHSIINEVKREYEFQYIDYFRSELFDDEDFQDVSHLNSKGAEKFTNILNNIIEW